MKYIYALTFFFSICSVCLAQPDSLWSMSSGNDDGSQDCRAALLSMDRCFVMAGLNRANTHAIYVSKVDENGNELWSKIIEGEWFYFCYGITEMPDSSYILAGVWHNAGRESVYDGMIMKLDVNGDSLWTRYYGGNGTDRFFDCNTTIDGGLVQCGQIGIDEEGGNGAWVVRTDNNGEVLWDITYGGGGNDRFCKAVETLDGGFAMAGYTQSFGEGGQDFFLVKTDSRGDEEWSNYYGTVSHENCYDMIQTHDGGYLMGGYSNFAEPYGEYYAVRTDSEGELLWERHYGTPGGYSDIMYSVLQTEDGGFILAGISGGYRPRNDEDFYIIRTDSSGEVLWTIGYGGLRGEENCQVLATTDGGYAFAGSSRSFDGGSLDFWLMKTGPDPVTVPRLIDPSYPTEFVLHSPYPNPFNSTTRIAFQLPYPSRVNLSIHDQQGREVTVLLNQNLTSGTHEVQWQGEDQPSGMYFCMMDADGFRISKGVAFVR